MLLDTENIVYYLMAQSSVLFVSIRPKTFCIVWFKKISLLYADKQ